MGVKGVGRQIDREDVKTGTLEWSQTVRERERVKCIITRVHFPEWLHKASSSFSATTKSLLVVKVAFFAWMRERERGRERALLRAVDRLLSSEFSSPVCVHRAAKMASVPSHALLLAVYRSQDRKHPRDFAEPNGMLALLCRSKTRYYIDNHLPMLYNNIVRSGTS